MEDLLVWIPGWKWCVGLLQHKGGKALPFNHGDNCCTKVFLNAKCRSAGHKNQTLYPWGVDCGYTHTFPMQEKICQCVQLKTPWLWWFQTLVFHNLLKMFKGEISMIGFSHPFQRKDLSPFWSQKISMALSTQYCDQYVVKDKGGPTPYSSVCRWVPLTEVLPCF